MASNAENELEDVPSLFAQVRFCIVRSEKLDDKTEQRLINEVVENGGIYIPPDMDTNKLPLDDVSHLISATTDFPEYYAANEKLIPVIKPSWVEACMHKNKVLNPRQYSPDPKHIFSDVVITCAEGLPTGDRDAIMGGVLALGGMYSKHITKTTTHLVALDENSAKVQTVYERRLNCKVVLPHWFDDCFKLGKRIDERPYMLPDPEILRKGPDEPIPSVGNPGLQGAVSPRPMKLPTPNISPAPHRRHTRVFSGRHVLLSSDLGIGDHLRGTIEDMIVKAGGMMTGSVHKTDILVCHYREGQEYVIASRAGKDVGNLAWLYHLLTYNTWTSPLRRLLHYPIARGGIPGFKAFRISLSNYSGEARTYLENLIEAAGGEYTKTMKQENTHLITAHDYSAKCSAAKEWNIHMINHLWLEESYAKWEIQSLSNKRYTHFPPRTNLGECVGQTSIDRRAIEKHFLSSAILKTVPEEIPVQQSHMQSPSAQKAKQPDLPSVTTPKHDRAKGNVQRRLFKTPAPPRFEDGADVTPTTTGSRKAKDAAVQKLQELTPDIALFQKQMKRVGGVLHGKPSKEELVTSSKKRHSGDNIGPLADDGDERDVKKQRRSKEPVMRLLLSSYSNWVRNPKKENEDKRCLRELGIQITQDPSHCTHLAAPHIVRTQKFITAIAYSPVILSTSFVDDCISKKQLLLPEKYILHDPASEAKMGFNLEEARKRAKQNKHKLLQGENIYVVEDVHGGFDTFKGIIEANGGACLLYRGRQTSIPPPAMKTKTKSTKRSAREAEADGDSMDTDGSETESETETETQSESQYEREPVYLISGTKKQDVVLWSRFNAMAERANREARIVKPDWLLEIAMAQTRKTWDDKYRQREDGTDK